MRFVKVFAILLVCLTFYSQYFTMFAMAQADDNHAVSALANSERELASSFQAVSKAADLGANVSKLVAHLNEAGNFLALAKMSYRLGQLNETISYAVLCSDIALNVRNEADTLAADNSGVFLAELRLTIVESLLSLVIVVFGTFWVWRFFKKRYIKRVLDMKPEVVYNES